MKSSRVIVAAERAMLMAFLQAHYPETKRTALKQLLRHRAVFVNGNAVTRPNHMLEAGDRVVVERGQPVPEKKKRNPGFWPEIVFEDRHIIVINKPEGLLTIATDKETMRTAYRQITAYVQEDRPHRGERIFIVHRLDRETSGLLVFARTEEAKRELQENWEDADKKYYAVVEGVPHVRQGKIRSHLREHPKSLKMHSAPPSDDAKLAVTKYKVIEDSRHFALLDITLETGRKNQIRAHLTELGHPVVGDKKYDAHTNPIKRLALHAYFLSFPHPVTGKRLVFKTDVPDDFSALMQEKKGPIIRSIANRDDRKTPRHTVEPWTRSDERREERDARYPRTQRFGGKPFARGGPQRDARPKGRSFDDSDLEGFIEEPPVTRGEEKRHPRSTAKPGPRRGSQRDDRGARGDFDRPRRDSDKPARSDRDDRGPRKEFDRPRREDDRPARRDRDDRGPRGDFDRPRRDSDRPARRERDDRGPRHDVPKQFRGRRADGLPRPDERPRDRSDERPARDTDRREPRRNDRGGPRSADDRSRSPERKSGGRPPARGAGGGKGRSPQRSGGRPGGKPPRRGR